MKDEWEIPNLKVVYSNFPPFVVVKKHSSELTGLMPDIMEALSKWLRFNYTLIREPQDNFGTFVNNSWTGMVGMLYRNEADIILNVIMPKIEILKFAYFTNPINVEAYTVLSGKNIQEPGLFLYFQVLDTWVWMSILATGLAIALSSTLIYKILNDSMKVSSMTVMRQYCWGLLTHMLRQNPSEKLLLRKSKKQLSAFLSLLTTLWILGVGFLVMSGFQSLLVSKLTFRKSRPFVDTFEDLLKERNIKGIAPVEIQLGDVLDKSGIPVYDKAWARIKRNLMPATKAFQDAMIQNVQKGKTCLFHGRIVLQSRISEFYEKYGSCQLHLSEKYFFPFSLPLTLHRRLSPTFYELFNLGVTRLIDVDIPGKWTKAATRISKLCTTYVDKELKPLRIQNIYGVLALWAIGLASSGILLIFEVLHKKMNMNTNRNQ